MVVRPAPERLDVWLGGSAPSELRRVGRLADGWLPSFVTPADAEQGRAVIEAECAEHDRAIDGDHYGVLIPYSLGALPEAVLTQIAKRRPDVDPSEIVPTSWDGVTTLVRRFVDVGVSKFVVLPLDEPTTLEEWTAHLGEAAATLRPLERGDARSGDDAPVLS